VNVVGGLPAEGGGPPTLRIFVAGETPALPIRACGASPREGPRRYTVILLHNYDDWGGRRLQQ